MTCEPWPVEWPCCVDGVSGTKQARAAELAVQLLAAMAGNRILGTCTYTEAFTVPAGGDCGGPYKDPDGHWRNAGRTGDCCKLLLTYRPVRSVTEVRVNGVVIDPAGYRMDGGWLRRIGVCWPASAECDEPPIVVVYTAGATLPQSTGLAVGEVACEFLNAMDGKACKLPSRAISVSRQGVTVELGDAADFIAAGRLGLPLADAWLRIVNPSGHKVRPRVYSPDLPRGSRVYAP